jgi:Histidine kinase-, DNA gyrase B-, and HSP90-like ATPase
MLDMHRAASQQLKIDRSVVDVLRDILEPVASMLYMRGAPFQVLVDCPHDRLIIETDPLRLKQIMLNLGRNAAKFVQTGFVRFRAAVLDNEVRLYVEDSGPGVPAEKRSNLFGRFQESLDTLNQGTGIGLALCKNLTELLHGQIWLDESFDSGIPGNPGACFVVNLRTPPVDDHDSEVVEAVGNSEAQPACQDSLGSHMDSTPDKAGQRTQSVQSSQQLLERPFVRSEYQDLPMRLKVLFVDDDFTLRKLFVRAVSRVAEDWVIDQASSGETAVSGAYDDLLCERCDLIAHTAH